MDAQGIDVTGSCYTSILHQQQSIACAVAIFQVVNDVGNVVSCTVQLVHDPKYPVVSP